MMNADDEDAINWDKVKATELRKVCVHECGHAAVARHFGGCCQVTITAHPDATIEESFYSGRCEVSPKLSTANARLAALAGAIAEQYDKNNAITGKFIETWIDLENITLTETDATGASGYTLADLNEMRFTS
jgi:hypothetical protein